MKENMNEPMFKNSMVEAIFAQAVIDNFNAELEELEKQPDIPVSERQKRRMAALFAKERRRVRNRVIANWTMRVAAVAASIVVILSLTLLTAPEVRASVAETFAKWFEEFVQFGSANMEEGYVAEWLPRYIPAGYAEVSNAELDAITIIRYADGSGNRIEFDYVTADNTISVNNEGTEYQQTAVNGIIYHLFSATDGNRESSIVWDTDGYLFTIIGNLETDDLLEMARSVEK